MGWRSAASVTVGNTSTAVIAAQARHSGAILTNDSDEAMYLAIGANAEMNKGIRLNANGGSITLNEDMGPGDGVWGICASGGKNLCYQERIS